MLLVPLRWRCWALLVRGLPRKAPHFPVDAGEPLGHPLYISSSSHSQRHLGKEESETRILDLSTSRCTGEGLMYHGAK